MPDETPQEQPQELRKTERYYVNKRIDSIEVMMAAGFQDLHTVIKESNAQTMAMFKECQKNCKNEVKEVKLKADDLELKVDSLTGYKNRAIGAMGIILVLLGIWKGVT